MVEVRAIYTRGHLDKDLLNSAEKRIKKPIIPGYNWDRTAIRLRVAVADWMKGLGVTSGCVYPAPVHGWRHLHSVTTHYPVRRR
ncbi:hypothetical protein BaRGS_00009883 [Batillaria attramentaria]|uniref:Uncharacterized protein n=1 Tax=Batillaria attramentaria TaxID=370345 RepID=A0ABD0LH02_9CAEN